MQVGITIPNSWGLDDPHDVVALGVLAEELGLDSVWVMDHLFNIGFVRDRLDGRPYYHPMAILTALSMRTERIILGTSVIVLPYHNPVELAKYVATLDHLSRGRVILGVGAGALRPEFEALGVSMRDRRALTDEAIELMRELWTAPEPSFQSERWNFSGAKFSPQPYQQPYPPIWVGGTSAGAKRRAALLGDGWHPNAGSPEEFAAACDDVRTMASEAGRDPATIAMSFRIDVALGEVASDPRHPTSHSVTRPDALVETLTAYGDAGMEHVVIAFSSGDLDELTMGVRVIANDVAPHLR